MRKKYEPLSTSAEWSYDLLHAYYHHVERIGREKFKLDPYPNQIEIISSEQMLEAYATHAMPLSYEHWSTGMKFVEELERYKAGMMGLAYEVVINSNPCIAYLMEENTMIMQILVMAHASMGHNHFFRHNYLFKQWTDAESIIDYLVYVRKFIRECEERYGEDTVEEVLDACHALMWYGVDKYKRPPALTRAQEEQERDAREKWIQSQANDIWRTIPRTKKTGSDNDSDDIFPKHSQENVLCFIEKNAPNIEPWKREIIRIVRKISQYFYPNMQLRLMNEGFATFMHYHILNELYDEGLIGENYMMSFLDHHTSVILQLDHDDPRYSGINVYALGFALYNEIKRVSMNPTEEDKDWFQHKSWVGNGEWLDNVLWAATNFKDESFILEFLTPKLMREFKMFVLLDDDQDTKYEISAIHNDQGYKHIREVLSKNYNLTTVIPEIQVARGGVDRWGDRSLTLEHIVRDRRPLDEERATETLKHANLLWGYDVKLRSVDDSHNIKAMYEIGDKKTLLDIFIDDDS